MSLTLSVTTCFGVVRKPGGDQPLLQPSVLCLIGFMVCLNWSSPEDNRSLQCFKLNYRCCKVCSESACTRGLFSSPAVWPGKVCVHQIPGVCQGWAISNPLPALPLCPVGAAAPKTSSLPQGDLGWPSLQPLHGPRVPELQTAGRALCRDAGF